MSRRRLPGSATNTSPLARFACKRLCPASPRLAPQAAAAVCLEFTRERQEARRLEDIQRGKGDEEDEGELREQLEDLGELEQDIAQVLQLDEAPQAGQQARDEEQREQQEAQPKRSAGRPRKVQQPEGEEQQQRPKRTPGRPRKVQQPLERQLDEVESKEEEQQ